MCSIVFPKLTTDFVGNVDDVRQILEGNWNRRGGYACSDDIGSGIRRSRSRKLRICPAILPLLNAFDAIFERFYHDASDHLSDDTIPTIWRGNSAPILHQKAQRQPLVVC